MENVGYAVTILCIISSFCDAQQTIRIPVQLYKDAILPCRLESADDGVSVRWFSKNDGFLSRGTQIYQHYNFLSILQPAPNDWNLRIQRVTSSFADEYTCQTDQGVPIIKINLVIETPPKIDEYASSPSHVTFDEHEEHAEVTCEAYGKPDPVISWFRGSTVNSPEIGTTGKKLIFPNITRYDSDVYICRATNAQGQVEKRINVSVKFPPEVMVMEPEIFAAPGTSVAILCVVQGWPVYDSYWVEGLNTGNRDDRLWSNWKYKVMEEEPGDGIPVKFITLIIRWAHDYNNYTCVAKGENGEAQASTQLRPIWESLPVNGLRRRYNNFW